MGTEWEWGSRRQEAIEPQSNPAGPRPARKGHGVTGIEGLYFLTNLPALEQAAPQQQGLRAMDTFMTDKQLQRGMRDDYPGRITGGGGSHEVPRGPNLEVAGAGS